MDLNDLEQNIDDAVVLLKSLSNEHRLAIICSLYKGEKNVGELEEIIGLSQSALSQHLARLRRDGLVKTRRSAQTIFYSMNEGATHAILKTLYDLYTP
ncbi:MAG: metalloregulator ArsR/SmtB family transcription factor [Alphaproteobacteria bacterium]|nr:metalloregulator ArsR/SmtB family transcription factor [Alphaproteobacteria bacterium]MDP7221883.1 metalloregulator ArsR/SmtB family transcription factor [Alphaproteobacteria bacterium]